MANSINNFSFMNFALLIKAGLRKWNVFSGIIIFIMLLPVTGCEKQEVAEQKAGVITLQIKNTLFTESIDSKNEATKVYFCEFPGNPPVDIPVSFYVRFYEPGTSDALYEFEGINDLTSSFEIPLDTYDVEVSSYSGLVVPRKSKDMILHQKLFDVDFTDQNEVTLGVVPVQTLVLIARQNLKPGNQPKFKTEFDADVSDLFEINNEYYGAFVAPEYAGGFPENFSGEIEMTDSAGKSQKVNEVWQRGKLVKYMNCPDAETGIQVASDEFTNIIDTIIQ